MKIDTMTTRNATVGVDMSGGAGRRAAPLLRDDPGAGAQQKKGLNSPTGSHLAVVRSMFGVGRPARNPHRPQQ